MMKTATKKKIETITKKLEKLMYNTDITTDQFAGLHTALMRIEEVLREENANA